MDLEKIEEQFLELIENQPLPWTDLLDRLDEVAAADPARADALAELLQETLSARTDLKADQVLSLLFRRARYRTDQQFRRQAQELCAGLQPDGCDLCSYCGFDADLPLPECLERLRRLLGLLPGVFCYSKSWGFGVVKDRDDYTGRMTVDFSRKPGHDISYAFAAESCCLLPENHPMVRRYLDPAKHDRLRGEQPGILLKNLLKYHGPMNAVALQELMIREALVPEKEWKGFWSNARRMLKNDPEVLVPARKNEPIQFVENPHQRFDADWLQSLAAASEPGQIIGAVAARESDGESGLRPEEISVISDRLTHVLRCATTAGNAVEALLMVGRLELPLDGEVAAQAWRSAADRDWLAKVMVDLPLRKLSQFFEFWVRRDAGAASKALLGFTFQAPARVVPLLATFLMEHGCEDALAESLRPFAQGHEQLPTAWVLHLLRNPDLSERLGLGSRALLPCFAVSLLESHYGDTRKTQTMPAEYLCRADRVRLFGDAMKDEQRRDLIRRLQALTQGPRVEIARSVMAAWIKVYPELAETAEAAAAPVDTRDEVVRLTSWRTWREKHRQLDKLIKVEIPANAREIGIARGYGDLRENHEYKAAREHQTILYRRQAELERDLALVKGTDFTGLPHDRAGTATCVRIRHDRGGEETMVILGEWDNEPELNIISCSSERARRLHNAVPGDRIRLPDDQGNEEAATVLAVEGLPAEVRLWMQADLSVQ